MAIPFRLRKNVIFFSSEIYTLFWGTPSFGGMATRLFMMNLHKIIHHKKDRFFFTVFFLDMRLTILQCRHDWAI